MIITRLKLAGIVAGSITSIVALVAVVIPPEARAWLTPVTWGPIESWQRGLTVTVLNLSVQLYEGQLAQARSDMATFSMRLRAAPDDEIAQRAWTAADSARNKVEFLLTQARCDIRRAQELGCAGL